MAQRIIICGLAILVLFSVAGYAQTMDETQLVMLLREFMLNQTNAAPEIRQEFGKKFREQTYLRYVRVNSALILPDFFGSGWLGFNIHCIADGRSTSSVNIPINLYFGGYTLPDSIFISGDLPGSQFKCSSIPQWLSERGISPDQSQRFLVSKKSYQDRDLRFGVLFPGNQLSNLRIGQKISFTGRIVGWNATSNRINVFLLSDRIEPESKMLK